MHPTDREKLLSTDPTLWLGLIIKLNQEPRYRNSLDAIVLINELHEVYNRMDISRTNLA